MDDIATKIGDILNDKQSMSQIMQLAQSLGFSGPQQQPPTLPNNNYNNQPDNQNGNDISALLSGLMSNFSVPNNQPANQNGVDLSSILSGLLNNLSLPNNNYNDDNSNMNMVIEDIPNQQNQGFSMPNFDMGMLTTIQKAMSSFSESNKNVELLQALKPHLSEPRQKKIDDAARIMQLLNVLPMLKESGIFGFLGGDRNGR